VANFVAAEIEHEENKGLRIAEPLASTLLYLLTDTPYGFSGGPLHNQGEETQNVEQDPQP
jgi:hypothetical protein